MKHPARHGILSIITVISLAVILIMVFLLLARDANRSIQIKELNTTIKRQNDTIISQTDDIFRLVKCLSAIPPSPDRTTEQRNVLIDKCLIDSRTTNPTPNRSSSKPQSGDVASSTPKAPVNSTPVAAPVTPSPPAQATPRPTPPPAEPPKPVLERFVDSVGDLIRGIGDL